MRNKIATILQKYFEWVTKFCLLFLIQMKSAGIIMIRKDLNSTLLNAHYAGFSLPNAFRY